IVELALSSAFSLRHLPIKARSTLASFRSRPSQSVLIASKELEQAGIKNDDSARLTEEGEFMTDDDNLYFSFAARHGHFKPG
ncbi:MAG: hypothetical protein ACRC7C_08065, partial [Beijerinckiaceae bacterium]